LGETLGRARITTPSARIKVRPSHLMRYAVTMVGDRDTAAEQWTRTRPRPQCDRTAADMNSLAARETSEIEESGVSFSDSRRYVMSGSRSAGVVPMLRMCVIPLVVSWGIEHAEDKGPRKRKGGKIKVIEDEPCPFGLFFDLAIASLKNC